MTQKWFDRQIDDLLLTLTLQSAFLLAHRRVRRMLPRVVRGVAVVTGFGVVAAAVATVVAGIAGVGAAGWGAAVWYRKRAKESSTLGSAPASDSWHRNEAGRAPVVAEPEPVKDPSSGFSGND